MFRQALLAIAVAARLSPPAASRASGVHLLQQKLVNGDIVRLFVKNYASYADFANGLTASTTLSPMDLAGSGYSVTGLTSDLDGGQTDPGVAGGIPAPTSWALMIAGFGLVGGAMRRRRVRPLLRVLALAGAASAASPAGAQIVGPGIPLGSPSYAVSCSGAQDSAYTDRSCGAGNSSSSVTLGPTPSAQAQATYPGDLAWVQSGASANLSYVFTVIGGEVGAAVPLNILMTLAASASGPSSYAFANVKVTTDLGVVSQTICTYGCGAGDGVGNFTGVLPMYAGVGSIGLVEMTAVAANGLSLDSLSASALADPYIYVDPTFADAARYSVVVSPGVGNRPPLTGGSVPEPAAWALMSAGFGLVGAVARRRRSPALAGLGLA